jgi:choline dehydrogenase-like flavoprotein
MDHVTVKAEGVAPGIRGEQDMPEDGRCLYLPRFDCRDGGRQRRSRGYGVQVYRSPAGEDRSYFTAVAFGEMRPRVENRITLDLSRRDAWGIPVLRIECRHDEAELAMARDQREALRELANLAEARLIRDELGPQPPGSAAHECGTARMGCDPSNSVLDPNNQCWDAKGLYLTDGASFPLQGSQNPTLTILALTARACNHALTS